VLEADEMTASYRREKTGRSIAPDVFASIRSHVPASQISKVYWLAVTNACSSIGERVPRS